MSAWYRIPLTRAATVKTFLRTEDHVWLMPENPSYEPILGDGCRIMGKVVATLHGRRDRR